MPAADRRDLVRLRTFYVARPGSGELRAAFVIDGRDYASPERVRADVSAAVAELHRRGLSAQFVTRRVDPAGPRPDLPCWWGWCGGRP